ncbi:hypothetical protein ACSS6W_006614 [Trichoderma asperelloides]
MCSASDDGLPETKAGDCAGRTPGSATPSLLALRHIPSDDQSSGGQQAAAKDACIRRRVSSSRPGQAGTTTVAEASHGGNCVNAPRAGRCGKSSGGTAKRLPSLPQPSWSTRGARVLWLHAPTASEVLGTGCMYLEEARHADARGRRCAPGPISGHGGALVLASNIVHDCPQRRHQNTVCCGDGGQGTVPASYARVGTSGAAALRPPFR